MNRRLSLRTAGRPGPQRLRRATLPCELREAPAPALRCDRKPVALRTCKVQGPNSRPIMEVFFSMILCRTAAVSAAAHGGATGLTNLRQLPPGEALRVGHPRSDCLRFKVLSPVISQRGQAATQVEGRGSRVEGRESAQENKKLRDSSIVRTKSQQAGAPICDRLWACERDKPATSRRSAE